MTTENLRSDTPEGMKRSTGYVALDDLTPNPSNPKAHDMATLDASVGRFGYVEPVVMDERTGYLISGHGRREALLAMRERGETAPEGVWVDARGNWHVPVSRGWRSRTDTEANAALIALNKTTMVGGWVDETLLDLLDDLVQDDDGLSGVGYDEEEIDALRARLEVETGSAAGSGAGPGSDYSEEDDDGEIGEPEFDLLRDSIEVVTVIPTERREEFYTLVTGLGWAESVRDLGA